MTDFVRPDETPACPSMSSAGRKEPTNLKICRCVDQTMLDPASRASNQRGSGETASSSHRAETFRNSLALRSDSPLS
jgi:hypothetical protein